MNSEQSFLVKITLMAHGVLLFGLLIFFIIGAPSLIQIYQMHGIGINSIAASSYNVSRIVFSHPILSLLFSILFLVAEFHAISKLYAYSKEMAQKYSIASTAVIGILLLTYMYYGYSPIFGKFEVWNASF